MYVIDQHGRNPIFQVNLHIGNDPDTLGENGETIPGDGQGIDGRIFSREFFETDALNPEQITTYTNSMGGDVQQSLDMFTAISRAKSRTKGIIAGFAYSCSGWIPLACDIVEMTTNSRWMCHMPFNPLNPEEKNDWLMSVVDIIATTISDKSGRHGVAKKTKQEVIQMMQNRTEYTAEEMWREGLIDKVVTPSGKLVHISPVNFDSKEVKAYYRKNQVALNLYIEEQTKITSTSKQKQIFMSYEKVVNRINAFKPISFNLASDSGEQDVLQAVIRMENTLTAKNDEATALMDKVKAMDAESMDRQKRLKEMESKAEDSAKKAAEDKVAYDKMCMNIENMEADNKILKEKLANFEKGEADAQLASKKLKAENLIAANLNKLKAANRGKTEEEMKVVVEKWQNRAVSNFEDTEFLLDSIQVANRIPVPVPHFATGKQSALNLDEKIKGDDGAVSIAKNYAMNKYNDNQKKVKIQEENRAKAIAETATT